VAPPPSGHPSAGGIVPFQPPPGLATVTPLTPAVMLGGVAALTLV
jgi:hypothetical protein